MSFSIPGNGEVLDDKTDDGTKEFLTIQTKNGNTFFLVLDRSSNTENVYMLSMIDENDLAEFMDETQTEETPQVVIPETETTVAPGQARICSRLIFTSRNIFHGRGKRECIV